ncbi:hypothetical protein ACFPPD_07835 [Cohnella suwonensis]|uniref:Uncharacterized protein n=1 Tax=Cohnella suwonensis TaxID=696072 RepID=A0ABW0LRX0_9BACL
MLIQEYAAYRIWKTDRELNDRRLNVDGLSNGGRFSGRRAGTLIAWLVGLVR